MNLHNPLAALALSLSMLMPGVSNAEVILPALDIQFIPGDGGYTIDATSLTIDATVTGIIDGLYNFNDIADQTFTLTAMGSHIISTPSGAPFPFISGSFDGTFTVGGGLLAGSFTGMTLSGPEAAPLLGGDVIITGGSLQNGSTGRLELALSNTSVAGKLGAVVPVPAAVWLFGSGLIGLVGIARRKA